jgi:hypothetical protein
MARGSYDESGTYRGNFGGFNEKGYWDAFNALQGWENNEHYTGVLGDAYDRFAAQFQQLVGRAPTDQEAGQLFSQVVTPAIQKNGRAFDLNDVADRSRSAIPDLFGTQIEQKATQDLQNQQGEANRLGDLFQQQGQGAINNVQQSLLDYQSRLFERIRPNLITSLQSQGLLNTGGMNEALAGQQADLAAEGSRQIADLGYQNEQAANAIRFGGAAAPYEYQKAQILNRVPQMQAQANNSMNQLFQQRFADQQFQNQMALLNRQGQLQQRQNGGFFQQMGGALAPALGAQLGQNFANFMMPNYTQTTSNPSTGVSTGKSGIGALWG